MDKPRQHGFALLCSSMLFLASVAVASCVAAEFKRTKKEDIKLDGKLCSLPGSNAFGLGVAALICVSIAQVVGNLVICRHFCLGKNGRICNRRRTRISNAALLAVSWMSYGVTVVLVGTASSMNRRQAYGEGWVEGECYAVRDGVFVGSAVLVLVAVSTTLAALLLTRRKPHLERGQKVHAQVPPDGSQRNQCL
ncbi:protein MODIFYING WALL LIGNIN-1-like [Malania oleifera]|uniref:protein MODIFYING WALL LIGNIN-1-like n=1 Tax=Malania oleifera TaxID=397392 RepID=UPI0025AE7363|nr:protein MODIFYING WALL LIGNIN-1-like [Malania oleifera]